MSASLKNSPRMMAVFDRISQERVRQRRLLAEKRISFNVASPVANNDQRLRVLVEEVGEVAKTIDQIEISQSRKSMAIPVWREELRKELVQVAAVATAWLESMEAMP